MEHLNLKWMTRGTTISANLHIRIYGIPYQNNFHVVNDDQYVVTPLYSLFSSEAGALEELSS